MAKAASTSKLAELHEMLAEVFLEDLRQSRAEGIPPPAANLVGYQQQVFVSGGSVVSIELDAGTGVFASTGQAVGGFMLSAGQSIRITYTTAPTVAVAHLGT